MDLVVLAAGNWFYEIWNWLWLLVCQGIYIFIGLLYQVFQKVSSINLFSSEVFEQITGRIYIVMGIAMLFIFAYNIILAIINPEGKDKGTGQLGKSVKETIISLVIVTLLPTIFNYMYIFQTDILESNIIGTIVLGGAGSTADEAESCAKGDYDCTCDFSKYNLDEYRNDTFWPWDKKYSDKTSAMTAYCKIYKLMPASQRGAYSIAPTVFSAFYRPANFTFEECADYLTTGSGSFRGEDKNICINYFTDVVMSKYTGDIGPFVRDSYLKDIVSDPDKSSMEFHWIMAVVAGIFALYMFFCYSMEIGVRVAKLGFLQLISPIPVMLRIVPGQKEKVYDKWFSHLLNAYLDVFIRLAIIYFVLFGISLVPDVVSTMWDSVWDGKSISDNLLSNFFVKSLVSVFVILGLLKFGQDAPALFKEFFGGSGNFALRSPAKQLADNKLIKGVGGGLIGGAAGMISNYYKSTHNENGEKKTLTAKEKRGAYASAAGGFVGGARRGAEKGYHSSNNFIGDMKQAKYETDKAREERRYKAKYASDKYGYNEKAFGASVIGGIGKTYADLKDFLITDGSLKVQANAASNAFSAFEDLENGFKGAYIKQFEEEMAKRRVAIESPKVGDPVTIGNTENTYKGHGQWEVREQKPDGTIETRTETTSVVSERFQKEEVNVRKRELYAKEYEKDLASLASLQQNAMVALKENLSGLGPDFARQLVEAINNKGIKLQNSSSPLRIDGNSIEDIEDMLTRLRTPGPEQDFKAIFDLNDTIKGELKNKRRDATAQAKKTGIYDSGSPSGGSGGNKGGKK